MRDSTSTRATKWTSADFKDRNNNPAKLINWKPPRLVYPCNSTEKELLTHLRDTFAPLPPHNNSSVMQGMLTEAEANNTLVTVPVNLPDGKYAFLENTAEKCTSPETKHSREGMQSRKHWVQRVDTADGIFSRLKDGYGVSLMFGERFHQIIRNSHNWRGSSGAMLDIDDWREPVKVGTIEYEAEQMFFDGCDEAEIIERTGLEKKDVREIIQNAVKPAPCFSQKELFDRYPLLPRICDFIIPSASSLVDGKPYKARGVILFRDPITDQRVYRAFGDNLLAEVDCIPANVTKNPLAVGFGNTHNAHLAHLTRDSFLTSTAGFDWIQTAIANGQEAELAKSKQRQAKREQQQKRKQAYNRTTTGSRSTGNGSTGENITAFLNQCDPHAELQREGLLFHVHSNRYKWKDSDSDTSCEYIDDDGGYYRIYSASMQAAGPKAAGNGAIAAHRFYLYYKAGLDLSTQGKSEKAAIRDYLYSIGYGSDPAAFRAQNRKTKLYRIDGVTENRSTANSNQNRQEVTPPETQPENEARNGKPDSVHPVLPISQDTETAPQQTPKSAADSTAIATEQDTETAETPRYETLAENEQARKNALHPLLDTTAQRITVATEVFDKRLPEIQTAIAERLPAERKEHVTLAIAETHAKEQEAVIAFLTERPAPPPIMAKGYIVSLNAEIKRIQRTERKTFFQALRGLNSDEKKQVFARYRTAQDTTRAALKTVMGNMLEKTHIIAVSDWTGTGKSHDARILLFKSENRTIALCPTSELAAQAAVDAAENGFLNTRHIRGRGVNWEQSGIEVIPTRMRDETLFDRSHCVMVDEVELYTKDNLPARAFCQKECPFFQTCKKRGYLAQFHDADTLDFLAYAMPTLPFNPVLHRFLAYLATGENADIPDADDRNGISLDTAKSTAEDETDTKDETHRSAIFDAAIVDDYEIDKLYNTCRIRQERIKDLRNDWKTDKKTHIASTFADAILDAFKETDNAQCFETLRKAVTDIADTDSAAETLNAELSQHARHGICEHIETPKTDETGNIISTGLIRFDGGAIAYIPTADNPGHAEKALARLELPFVERRWIPPETRAGETLIVPTHFWKALMSYDRTELSPLWHKNWTLLHQLQALIASVATPENAPVRIADGYIEFDVPPQVNGLLKTIVMLSPKDNTEDLKRALDGQNVTIDSVTAKPCELASGVKLYQYCGDRITSASVFERPKNDDGETLYQCKPTGISPKHAARIDKLNAFARETDGLSLFVSYKEFQTHFPEVVKDFDYVKNFDEISGLNIEGLKRLVIYGMPKASLDVVMPAALRQYAGDPNPIPRGDPNFKDEKGKRIPIYEQLTEVKQFDDGDGLLITERRYIDARLRAVHEQLTLDKLNQTIGRARHVRWTDTETIIFTNAKIANTTDRPEVCFFTSDAFNAAESPSDIPTAQARTDAETEQVTQAEQAGDIDAVMELTGKTRRTAERRTKPARTKDKAERNAEIIQRAAAGEKQQTLADEYGLTQQRVSKIIRCAQSVHNTTFRHTQLSVPIGHVGKLYNAENASQPCLPPPSQSVHSAKSVHPETAKSVHPETPRDDRIIQLHLDELSLRKITDQMHREGYKVSFSHISKVVKAHQVTLDTETPETETETQRPSAATGNPSTEPIPPSEYHTLTEQQARAELERLTAAHNYNAAYLQRQFITEKWKR